ncbi:MAG: hypothetical protein L0228_03655 [Planctomycetes bacterium]|nr:hypothetical protein [Planctomycetota bacterium]
MEIPVLIEPIPGSGYRASGGEPFAIVVEGTTPEDALARFKDRIATKLRNGASVASVEVQNEHPWAKSIGIFDESDPLVRRWLELIEENRSRPEELE